MKVLHIIDSGGLYGAEVMLLSLMEEQRQLGLIPILASIGEYGIPEKPLETEVRRRGLRVVSFRMQPGPNFAGALKILRFAKLEGVDIFHSHGYKPNILFGLMPRKMRGMPMVATLHGWTWSGGVDRMALYEWLDRLSLHFIDQVILVNDSMRSKVKLKQVRVVKNGIPLDSPDSINTSNATQSIFAEIAEFSGDGFTIGTIGRLSREKGFDILLHALKELSVEYPKIRLVIIGEGSERNALEAQVKRLGLEGRVLMPGYVAGAGHYLALFRLFALPSLTEGLPMVILEAMQAGVPIVASRVGGIPEVLDNGKAGIMIEPGKHEALVKGIEEVISNPAPAAQRAQMAMQRLNSLYSSRTMAENYLGIYKIVLQSNSTDSSDPIN